MARVLKIFFHDACFDGTTSAALFSAFYRDVIAKDVEIRPIGMVHKDGNPFDGIALDADDHACVDFRFCADPRMTWWFDHHPTAFQPPELRDTFEQVHLPTWVFDPSAPSCAGLIARALKEKYGWAAPPHLVDAVEWADTIDAAQFPTAEDAVALVKPAQRLAAWLAHGRTPVDTARYVEWLSHSSLAEVAQRPEVAPQLAAVQAERAAEIEAIKQLATWAGDVVVFDRFDQVGARSPGFLGYLLFPQSVYAVTGTRTASSIKISVGVNPWKSAAALKGPSAEGGADAERPRGDVRGSDNPHPHGHDIGALCAKYGGGGHAVVGGVTLRGDELPRARATLAALVEELQK